MIQDQQERIVGGSRPKSPPLFAIKLLAEDNPIIVTAQGQPDPNTRPTVVAALAKAKATNQREVGLSTNRSTGLISGHTNDGEQRRRGLGSQRRLEHKDASAYSGAFNNP